LSSVPRRRNNAQCSTKSFSPTDADADDGTDAVPGTDAAPGTDADDGTDAVPRDRPGTDAVPRDRPGTDAVPRHGPGTDAVPRHGPGYFDHAGAAANFDRSDASPSATFCRWHSCRK
jgi:hypothetical protein